MKFVSVGAWLRYASSEPRFRVYRWAFELVGLRGFPGSRLHTWLEAKMQNAAMDSIDWDDVNGGVEP